MNPFSKLFERSGRVTTEPLIIYQGKTAIWTLDTARHQVWNDIQQFAYPIEHIEWEFFRCSILAGSLRLDVFPQSIVWYLGGQQSVLCTLVKDGLEALDSLQAYSLARGDHKDPLSINGPLGALGILSTLPPQMMQSSWEEIQASGIEYRPSKLYSPF